MFSTLEPSNASALSEEIACVPGSHFEREVEAGEAPSCLRSLKGVFMHVCMHMCLQAQL